MCFISYLWYVFAPADQLWLSSTYLLHDAIGKEVPITVMLASWLPLGLSWWRICLQCGRTWFNPWVGKERLSIPVFWPGEFHGLYGPRGFKESDRTEQISLSLNFMADGKPKRSNMWFFLKLDFSTVYITFSYLSIARESEIISWV